MMESLGIWNRFKDDKNINPNMLISGFIDGEIIYIIEFPFNTTLFLERLTDQLKKKFPKGDVSGEYLRSASFNYKHFIDSSKIIYTANSLKNYEKHIVKPLYNKL